MTLRQKINPSVQQIGTIQICIVVSNTNVAPSIKTLPVLKLCYILLLISRETNKNSTRTPEPLKTQLINWLTSAELEVQRHPQSIDGQA